MSDGNTIRAALDRELLKHIRKRNQLSAGAKARKTKFEKRSGLPGGLSKLTSPSHWEINPRFDPFYVRSRIDSLVHALANKARSLKYVPDPSLTIQIPKASGGTREICISAIPDAALSYWLGKKLIERNAYKFSSYSYAYRADRNAHHAIDHLMTSIRGKSRLFVLEYDFAQYFDSIRHD
jgi:RNA-directed DNA polymerase